MAEEVKEEKIEPHTPFKGEKTIRAVLKVKHFICDGSVESDEEVNKFMETIDNVSRFLNARNAYEVAGKSCLVVWYLEKLAEEVEVEEFGTTEETVEEVAEEIKK